jgi:hypothetical protein
MILLYLQLLLILLTPFIHVVVLQLYLEVVLQPFPVVALLYLSAVATAVLHHLLMFLHNLHSKAPQQLRRLPIYEERLW